MVRGIDIFSEFFAGYEDNYIIIGGAACDIYETQNAQKARATKDLDIILIIEALSAEFVAHFWEFIKRGGYLDTQKGESKEHHEYFRFQRPSNNSFPQQLELFSRSLNLINFPEDARLTPVPIDEELSSLSAILMEESYYNYTIEHSCVEEGVHIANIESLIVLKSRAYIDLRTRKEEGERIDNRKIIKHKNDIFRLGVMLSPDPVFRLPEQLYSDVSQFCELVAGELPDTNFFKSIGSAGTKAESVHTLLKSIFTL